MLILWLIAIIGILVIAGPTLASIFNPVISGIICFIILLISSPIFYLTAWKEMRQSRMLDTKLSESKKRKDYECAQEIKKEKDSIELKINRKLSLIITIVFFAIILILFSLMIYNSIK